MLRAEGFAGVAIKCLQELHLYRRLEIVEVPFEPRTPRPLPGAVVSTRLLESTADDLAAYGRFRGDLAAADARARLAAGQRCFITSLDGRFASTEWVATGRVRVDYPACDFQLAPGLAYIHDAFTLPELRGKDLKPWQGETLKREMKASGCSRLIAAVLPENRSQKRRHERRGFVSLGVVGWVGVGRWRRTFLRVRLGDDLAQELTVLDSWRSPQ